MENEDIEWNEIPEDNNDIMMVVILPQNRRHTENSESPRPHSPESTVDLPVISQIPGLTAKLREIIDCVTDELGEIEDSGSDNLGTRPGASQSKNQEHSIQEVSSSTSMTSWKLGAACKWGLMFWIVILFICLFVTTFPMMHRFF